MSELVAGMFQGAWLGVLVWGWRPKSRPKCPSQGNDFTIIFPSISGRCTQVQETQEVVGDETGKLLSQKTKTVCCPLRGVR